jgi:hypothetical protein
MGTPFPIHCKSLDSLSVIIPADLGVFEPVSPVAGISADFGWALSFGLEDLRAREVSKKSFQL